MKSEILMKKAGKWTVANQGKKNLVRYTVSTIALTLAIGCLIFGLVNIFHPMVSFTTLDLLAIRFLNISFSGVACSSLASVLLIWVFGVTHPTLHDLRGKLSVVTVFSGALILFGAICKMCYIAMGNLPI